MCYQTLPPPLWNIQDSGFSSNILCFSWCLCSEREPYILFLYCIFLLFPQIVPLVVNSSQTFPPSLPLLLSSYQKSLPVGRKGKQSHNGTSSGASELIQSFSWKIDIKYILLIKGTYFILICVFVTFQNPLFSVHIE